MFLIAQQMARRVMLAARVHKPGPPDVIVVESVDVKEPRQQRFSSEFGRQVWALGTR